MEKGIPIRSVSRSLAALKVINQHGSLTMKEIAIGVDVPYPTACRIIQTLIHEGFVEQEPNRKRYRPTVLVQSLSQGYVRDGRLIQAARPAIEQITEQLGWPVSITTRVGGNMVLRDSTHARTSMTFECYYPGFSLPIVECASGRLALAYSPPQNLKTLIAGQQVNGEKLQSPADAERLLHLEEIRRQYFAWMGRGRVSLTPGRTSSIAVPIMENGQMSAALTLIYFHNALSYTHVVSDYLPILKDKAMAITANLAGKRMPEDGWPATPGTAAHIRDSATFMDTPTPGTLQ